MNDVEAWRGGGRDLLVTLFSFGANRLWAFADSWRKRDRSYLSVPGSGRVDASGHLSSHGSARDRRRPQSEAHAEPPFAMPMRRY